MLIREIDRDHRAAAVDIWSATGLTRPWNEPNDDFDRATDGPTSVVLGALEDDTLVGTVMVGHDGHRGWVYYLAVRPESQRQGVARLLMDAAESWLAETGAVKLNLMVRHSNTASLGFYERLGYADAEVTVLAKWLQPQTQRDRVPRPAVGTDDGFVLQPAVIRPAIPADCDSLGLITVTASLATFHGRIPDGYLDLTWTPQDSAAAWRGSLADLGPSDFLDVYDDPLLGLIGFVWAGPSGRVPGAGEVRGLYVLPSRQGRGVGRQLLVHAAREFHRRSLGALIVGCIRENPSCDFYRHLGGEDSFSEPHRVDAFETEEIFFVWRDIETLL